MEEHLPSELDRFESMNVVERRIDILAEDLGLDRQKKHYYRLKALEEIEYGT